MKRLIFLLLLGIPFLVIGQSGFNYVSVLDTITDTEQDTVTSFSKRIYAPHTVSCQCQFTELSGSSDITLYLEGSNTPAGNVWHVIQSDTIVDAVNAATLYLVSASTAQTFVKYRFRVSGDSGSTQSQQYRCVIATREDQ